MTMKEIVDVISTLTPPERAQLAKSLVQDLAESFPGITSTPSVCGGAARVVRTRIPVWLLEQARRLGASEADLLRDYPSLTAEDLTNAWAYIRAHRAEIEELIVRNEAA